MCNAKQGKINDIGNDYITTYVCTYDTCIFSVIYNYTRIENNFEFKKVSKIDIKSKETSS